MKYNRISLFIIIASVFYTCKKDSERQIPSIDEYTVQTIPAYLSVDENVVVRKAESRLLGYNHNWYESQRVIMEGSDNLTISEDFYNVARRFQLPMPLNRMSGTVSQAFKWKWAIGLLEGRSEQQLVEWSPSRKQTFGPIEWIKSVRGVDINAEFTWTINMVTDTVQDDVDLVEFLTGNSENDINGGVNWAAKREGLGIKEPVKVAVWELGNEVDWGELKNKFPVDVYIAECKKIIGAIRAISPDAKFAVCGASSPWGDSSSGWRDWNQKILKEIGSQIDYIVFHPYYLGISLSYVDQFMDAIRSDIVAMTGSSRVKIYISEHAVWPSNLTDKTYETHDLNGVLGTAEFLNRIFYRTEIAMAAYHSFSAGPWFIMEINKINGKRYLSGIADIMKLFNDAIGNDVVKITISGDATSIKSGSCRLTASAMTTEKGLNLILVNRDSNKKREVSFQFANHYKLTKKTTLTADDLLSYNTAEKKAINTETTMVSETADFKQYVVPEKSMVVLYLEKK